MSFGLAAPLWLLGLLGLVAPLVLHLLARGRGRRVRVGSVRLLTDSPPRRLRRLQLQRPLLLALRCLLLALVALALAGPRLRREAAATTKPRSWVLVEPGIDARAVDAARRAIAGGAEVHLLATGVPLEAATSNAAALPDVATVPGGSWSLLREAAATAPAGTNFCVVTSGRLASLRGERPALANTVEWLDVPDARPNRWVARLLAGGAGPAQLVGDSDRARTIFEREPASTASARSLRVGVLAGADRQADARYVRAALGAAAEAAGVRVEISPAKPTAMSAAATAPTAAGEAVRSARVATTPPVALTFWLADAAPPAPLLAALREGGVLITDSGAPEESCEGTFTAVESSGPTLPRAPLPASDFAMPLSLHRCGAAVEPELSTTPTAAALRPPSGTTTTSAPQRAGQASIVATTPLRVRWRTDAGRIVLAQQTVGNGSWLRFGSRFHPAWSDLVLSPAFPAWLRDVLRSAAGGAATSELADSDRRADGGQGRPASRAATGKLGKLAAPLSPAGRQPTATSATPASPLPERAAWLLLFPLFLAERWLATRR